MFIVNNYALAIVFCFITMLCWGSWVNTQKLASKSWRYELFYWDYVIGILLLSFVVAITAGSIGAEGRPFFQDLAQASWNSIGWIILGAVVFNISNVLLSAATSISGMSVSFPLGVGLALVVGVVFNLIFHPKGENLVLLFLGVGLVVLAIVCNGIASGKVENEERDPAQNRKGIILAAIAGIIMAFFPVLVYNGVDLNNFQNPEAGKVTPYTAMFLVGVGIFLSNFIINTIIMKKPFVGEPVTYKQYFSGSCKTHLVGVLGGAIWALGTVLNYISAGKAGASISYALGEGAPMVAAIWGVFIWKEFKGAKKGVYGLLVAMFALFFAGLAIIIAAGN